MYSGTTFRHNSGNVLGAHQKIDRLAGKHVRKLLPKEIHFPLIKDILHFEGNNGPDGIKRKSPSRDEPWHYFDPLDQNDIAVPTMILDHSYNLTQALALNNYERASFEAAWLAHTIVDGLTPAHHYPLEEKIEELWGHPKEMRLTVRQKNIIVGKGYRDTVSRNWQYWGAKGVFTTHFMFGLGVATTMASLQVPKGRPTEEECQRVLREGIASIFKETALQIHELGMYETFYKKGWNRQLARQTKEILAPLLVKTVALAWFESSMKAALIKNQRGV